MGTWFNNLALRNTKALGLSFPHLVAHSRFRQTGRSLQCLVTMLGRATRWWITPSQLPAATGTKLAPPCQGSTAAPLARLEILPSNPLFLPLLERPLDVKQQKALPAAPRYSGVVSSSLWEAEREDSFRLVILLHSFQSLTSLLFWLPRVCSPPQNPSIQQD